jgi:uncharacterized repeat protein (TIGR02543 family)
MSIRKTILTAVFPLLWVGALAQEEYNPENPPDPSVPYKVTVAVSPSEAGYASGGGKYSEGAQVYISTSANYGYEFQHWTLNGEYYANTPQLNYVMTAQPANFVAVYSFNPISPSDPVQNNYSYRLYLTNNADDACTFNIVSGNKYQADQYVYVSAMNISPGFVFQGWFQDGQKISDVTSFNYLMPYTNVTLTARFVYDPEPPPDPEMAEEQNNVDQGRRGDLNGDGLVNISDAVLLINHYLNGTTDELTIGVADVNNDGEVNISDAVEIVNRYLNNQ